MTDNERILYTFIIRALYKHSYYSRFAAEDSAVNKFLSAEEILAILKEDAKTQQALNNYFKEHPSLSPADLDQFLSTVKDKEYPKEINQTYFHCNEESSKGKTIQEYHPPGHPFQYAIPKKKEITSSKDYKSNDFLVLLGIVLTETKDDTFTISDLRNTLQKKFTEEHIPCTQTLTRIVKKLCHDENIKKLGFYINYDEDQRTRVNEELSFYFCKILAPFEASMLADMLKTYPYYSAEFANKLIKKLQFFDENGTYSFSTNNNKLYHSTPNIPTLIDTSIRGSFRLNGKECDQFLHHIDQLKTLIRNKQKAIMTYGQRIIDPNKNNAQTLAVRETTVVHPHEVLWANGYYYFVATPENKEGFPEKHAHNYRIDRIIRLEAIEKSHAKPIYDEQKDFSNGQGANFSPVAYRGTHNMMVRGDIYNIKLKCKKNTTKPCA